MSKASIPPILAIRLSPMDRVALERAARADDRPVSTFARKIIVEWLHVAEGGGDLEMTATPVSGSPPQPPLPDIMRALERAAQADERPASTMARKIILGWLQEGRHHIRRWQGGRLGESVAE